MKRSNYKKIFFFAPMVLGIVSTTILIGNMFNKKEDNVIHNHDESEQKEDIIEKINIFPKLNKYDIYEHLRIENESAIINEQIILNVLLEIFKKTNIPFGQIKFDYKIINQKDLTITIEWITNSNSIYKTYFLSIKE